MASQAKLSSGRQVSITTAGNAAEPDASTNPSITLGPQSATGLKTTGALLSLQQPPSGAAVPNAGGFGLICWFRNPVSHNWASAESVTIDFRQLFACFEFDAIEIYFQIDAATVTTAGAIIVEVMEQ